MTSPADIGEFFVDVQNGNIVQMRVATKYFNKMKEVDGSYKITIKRGKRRSNKQNRYYWGVVVAMVFQGLRDQGFDTIIEPEDAHLVCKSMFLKEVEEHNGIKIEKAGSSKKLTKKEFEEYVAHITLWAWDYLNIVIPAPGQQMDMDI